MNLINNLEIVTQFVASTLTISAADALPYEAQWLFLVTAVRDGHNLADFSEKTSKWIKRSSFYETLQGRPDHALIKMIEEISILMGIGIWPEDSIADVNPSGLAGKRFLRKKAVTVAFLEMLAERGLFRKIGLEDPLKSIPYDSFAPIFDQDVVSAVSHRSISYPRTIPNTIFVDNELFTRKSSLVQQIIDAYDQRNVRARELLNAQFIDNEFVDLIRNGEYRDALHRRAEQIGDYAAENWTS